LGLADHGDVGADVLAVVVEQVQVHVPLAGRADAVDVGVELAVAVAADGVRAVIRFVHNGNPRRKGHVGETRALLGTP
jgi:hypothetical protein